MVWHPKNRRAWIVRPKQDRYKLNYYIYTRRHMDPVQFSERFIFCLQQQTVCALNDHCSGNCHVSLIYSNSSLIAHSLGDIEYFYPIGSAIFVRYSKPSKPSACLTFAANSGSAEQTEQTFNKTFAVFAALNGPTESNLQLMV